MKGNLKAHSCVDVSNIREITMICRNCNRSKVNRPRGLCWSCYYRPGVREQYPSTSKFARRGVGNFCGAATQPTEATTARPGTAEKIAVLAERARLRQDLWHPDDGANVNERAIERGVDERRGDEGSVDELFVDAPLAMAG
jgi:hypothetical protein